LLSGNVDLQKFSECINSKKIIDCLEEEIKNHLKLIFLKVGIRANNLPTELETTVLLNFIYENYSNFRINEISLAFDLAIKKVLEVEIKHFESFSTMYFAGIMATYIPWAKSNLKELPKKEFLQIEDKKELTDQESEDWIAYIKGKYLAGDYLFNFLPLHFYNYLNSKEKFSTKQKIEAFQHSIKKRILEVSSDLKEFGLKSGERQLLIKNIEYLQNPNKNIKDKEFLTLTNIAKRLLISEYFKI
jgi:hypothetical protein